MPTHEDTFNNLLGLLYAGAADAARMPYFLARVGELGNAHTSVIQIEDRNHARGILVESVGAIAMGSDEIRAYAENYVGENVWVHRGTHLLLRDGVISGAQIINPVELTKTPFYQGFLRPLDIHDSIGALLWNGEDSSVAMLTLNCSKRQGAFGEEQRALLQRLLPHLQNAYALRRRLSWVDDERRGLRAALDRLRCGVLLVDLAGCVRIANAVASEMLAGRLDLGISVARLRGLEVSSRKALYETVLAVLNPESSVFPRTLVLLRSSGQVAPTFIAVVASLHISTFADFDIGSSTRVVVFLHSLRANASVEGNDQWLMQAYGLSPTQARLTRMLCRGMDLRQCAIALNNRMPTVRTQLKAIFLKTGTRRQAELVAMLAGMLGI